MVKQSMDLLELLRKRGIDGDMDLLREALRVLVDGIMDAEVSAQIGAQHGERSPERVTYRNGYRNRTWDTRVGTMALHIPKLREGNYFPSLLEPRRRSEKALLAVIQQTYVEGVSTRRVDDFQGPGLRRYLQQPGVAHLRATGRSGGEFPGSSPGRRPLPLRLAGRPDPEGSGGRPHRERLRGGGDGGQCRRAAGDPGYGRGRQRGRRLLAGLPAVADRSGPQRGGAGYLRCPPGAEERHRRGVRWGQLATLPHPLHGQPAHPSAQARPTWRGHPGPSRMVRTIYQQLSPAEVHAQLDRVVEQLREPFPQVAELLADAAPDLLAFTAFPVAHWQKLWSNNPQERLNREIRRRTDVVGIFPNRLSARRLVGAVLAEQHDEWAEARRYLTIPSAAGNEALPTPNMLDAAA